MDPERWSRVKELFGSALERDPNQRSAFLREACGQDESLRAEVESLLASYNPADSFIERPMVASPPSLAAETVEGRRIGSYQILREIGHGGMAVVYLAARADDQYRKRVAIKVVSPGPDNKEVLRRFLNERQTLAALDHPNIVRLLDGGSTEEGLPYLVMDFVEGMPIDEYCDSRRLSVTERLELFCTVCAAVQYAHKNLVIHRDVKPANILVTAEGVPKLLDFGIAKLLQPELASGTLVVTQSNVRPMTPEYASPEQVRGQPITSGTDVYSLGVLLYELLTGHRPYRLKRHTPLEVEHAICEDEPEKPSTAIGRVEEAKTHDSTTLITVTPDLVSSTREGRPEKLRRRLHGDLDNILLMALRKEPQRRYASVEQFSEDIRRHLQGLPVMARPNTLQYRASKFVRRHRMQLVAAVLIMLTLLGGIVTGRRYSGVHFPTRPSVAVLGFKNLSRGPDDAWLSGALAEMLTHELAAGEKLRTIPGEDVSRMKKDLSLSESGSYGKQTLAQIHKYLGTDEVVLGSCFAQQTGGQIRLDLQVQDAVRGETIASVSETGNETNLLDLVSRAGAQLRQKLGVGAVSPVEAVAARASLPSNPEATRYYAEGLEKLRQFDALAARDLLEKAIAADPQYALAHSALSAAWSVLGYDGKAQQEAKLAFDLAANLGREERLWIEAQYRETTNQWDRAIEIYRALWDFFPDNLNYALRLAQAEVSAGKGKDALATVDALRQLPPPASGDARVDLAEANAARSLFDLQRQQAAATRAAAKAQDQGARLMKARALLSQGGAFAQLAETDKAMAPLNEAKRIFEEAGDKVMVAATLDNLGTWRYYQRDLNGAKRFYEESLKVYREIGAKSHVAGALNNLASVLSDQRDLAGAMKMRNEALAIFREIGDRSREAVALGNIGNVLYFQGDLAGAKKRYEESLAIRREIGTRINQVVVLNNLAAVLRTQGDLLEAKKTYEESVAICHEFNNKGTLATALSGLGEVLLDQGNLVVARKNAEEALKLRSELGQKTSVAVSRVALAGLFIEEAQPGQAEGMARDAAVELENEKHDDEATVAYIVLAKALLTQRKSNAAQKAIDRAASLSAQSKNREIRFDVAIANARVRAALTEPAEATKILEATLAEAAKHGYVGYELDARLALGEVEMKSGRIIAGRARLSLLEKDARAKGFGLIARKAAVARS